MRLNLLIFAVLQAGVYAIAPILGVGNSKAVPDSYIVVLKKGLPGTTVTSHLKKTNEILGVNKRHDFDLGGLKGYHFRASSSVVQQLAQSDEASFALGSFNLQDGTTYKYEYIEIDPYL